MNAREFFQGVNSKMRGWGYTIEEQEGCWARSNGVGWSSGVPLAHTNHHFVIPMNASFEGGAQNVTYGDSTLSGPKCNYYGGIDAATGRQRLRMIAAGTANHPGRGRIEPFQRMMAGAAPLGWVATSYSPVADNWTAASSVYCGTEWHHPGDSTPWPDALISMAVDLNAAMCLVAGWGANRCHMHAEHSARKIDMSYRGTQGGHSLRSQIAARLGGSSGGPVPPTPTPSGTWFPLNLWLPGKAA